MITEVCLSATPLRDVIFNSHSCVPVNEPSNVVFFTFVSSSLQKRSLPRGLKWHGGGLIILLPHPAGGCDTAIISGPWINSVTKERSAAPARPEREEALGDYTRWSQAQQKHLLPSWAAMKFKGLRSRVSLIGRVCPLTITVQTIKAGIFC